MTYCCLSLDDDDVDYWMGVADAVMKLDGRVTFFPTFSKITEEEWGALRDLMLVGHEIGVHSLTHIPLPPNPRYWFREVIHAANLIELYTGKIVTTHAMPYGQTSPELIQWYKDKTTFLGVRSVGHVIKPLSEIDPFDVPVMDRDWLKGDGTEKTVRENAGKYLNICREAVAPFLFYSHNQENMTVDQIGWVVDELHQRGETFITFAEFMMAIRIST
jgi:peptidoglycan/xylan/chitin deacetylase (PgdA/CDA1 family)